MLFPYISDNIYSIYASQILCGVTHLFIVVIIQNSLGHIAKESKRDFFYGLYTMVNAIGTVIGPVLGGYISNIFSYSEVFLVSLSVGFFAIIITLFISDNEVEMISEHRDDDKLTKERSQTIFSIVLRDKNLRNAIAISAIISYSKDIFIVFFPVLAFSYGMNDTEIGWLISIHGIAIILSRSYINKLLKIFERITILKTSIILIASSFVFITFSKFWLNVYFFSIILGFGVGVGTPLTMSTAYKFSPINRTAEVMSTRLAMNRLGQTAAPLILGVIGSVLGVASIFIINGIFVYSSIYFNFKDK